MAVPTLLTTMSNRPNSSLATCASAAVVARITEVGHHGTCPPTELLGRVDDLREFRPGPGRDQNVRPGLGQRERRPGTDPTTGPGDHGHPAVDPEPIED